jgi:hypothetical protein
MSDSLYKKAKDLKFGDIIFQSYNGVVREYSTVNKIELRDNFIIVNDRFVLKLNGAKCVYMDSDRKFHEAIVFLEKSEFSITSSFYCIDKTVAITHALNYLKLRNEEDKSSIINIVERMNERATQIAKLLRSED